MFSAGVIFVGRKGSGLYHLNELKFRNKNPGSSKPKEKALNLTPAFYMFKMTVKSFSKMSINS